MNPADQRLIRGGSICGMAGIVLYIGLALWGGDNMATRDYLRYMNDHPHAILGHFAVAAAAVLWLVGFVAIGKLLQTGGFPNAARLGTVFGIVACGILSTMLIVQGSVMAKMGSAFVAAQTDAQREAVVSLYRGLRIVDQGMDLAFDLFFFTGWICLCVAMLRHGGFPKILPWLMIAIFVCDTPLQLWYAPTPPPFDVGPFASVLLIVVFALAYRAGRKLEFEKTMRAAAP